jgi:hypothetical protein
MPAAYGQWLRHHQDSSVGNGLRSGDDNVSWRPDRCEAAVPAAATTCVGAAVLAGLWPAGPERLPRAGVWKRSAMAVLMAGSSSPPAMSSSPLRSHRPGLLLRPP